MILAALFLALAYVMPFLTGQIPEVGQQLCPLHIPVLLCGFICGWPWGLAVGVIAPLLRSLTLFMPPLFPTAVCMAFELGAYGAVSGLLHRLLPKKTPYIYCSLLSAMIIGRMVFGIVKYILLVGVKGDSYTLALFFGDAFVGSIPGIIVQILIVPILVTVLERIIKLDKI